MSQVRRWWAAGPRRRPAAEPYDVACACGGRARGLRQARHQVVRCPGCGGPVFVLGHSPLAPASADPATGIPRRYWVGPALAAAITLAAVVVIFSRLIPALAPTPAAAEDTHRDEVRRLVGAGREALRREDFRIAAARFADARRRSTSARTCSAPPRRAS